MFRLSRHRLLEEGCERGISFFRDQKRGGRLMEVIV